MTFTNHTPKLTASWSINKLGAESDISDDPSYMIDFKKRIHKNQPIYQQVQGNYEPILTLLLISLLTQDRHHKDSPKTDFLW